MTDLAIAAIALFQFAVGLWCGWRIGYAKGHRVGYREGKRRGSEHGFKLGFAQGEQRGQWNAAIEWRETSGHIMRQRDQLIRERCDLQRELQLERQTLEAMGRHISDQYAHIAKLCGQKPEERVKPWSN